MKKIRAAVVGYGNIGKSVVEALQAAPDFEIAGIIRRNGAENKPAELAASEVVKDITELKDVDFAYAPMKMLCDQREFVDDDSLNVKESVDFFYEYKKYFLE